MSLLTIEKDERRKSELTAKLDGVEIPHIEKIEIVSICGQMTRAIISVIVGCNENQDKGVIIKDANLQA